MDAYAQMELHKDDLTPRERYVYDAVMANSELVRGSSSTELARALNVSQSVISRFCQKIGFSGYGEFRMNLYVEAGKHAGRASRETSTVGESSAELNDATDPNGRDVAAYFSDAVFDVRQALPDELLSEIAERIVQANDVYTCGYGASAIPAHLMATLLTQSAIRCHNLLGGDELWPLRFADNRDLYVLFSLRNPSHSNLISTVSELDYGHRPYLLLITSTVNHPFRKQVDEVIVLPIWSSVHAPVYLTPVYATTLFCMFLSHTVSEMIGSRLSLETT